MRGAQVVIACLSTSQNVAALLDGPDGILAGIERGALFVDCTSGDPSTSARIAERLAERDVAFIDAPVSGGTSGAEKGILTVMVGGDAAVLERARPVLESFGRKIVHCGKVGAGDAVKAMNNAMLAIHVWSTGECMAALARAGVDPGIALDVVNASSGRSNTSENLFPERVLTRAFPRTFRLALLDKDIGIAAQVAREQKIPSPILQLTAELFRMAHAEARRGSRPRGSGTSDRTPRRHPDQVTRHPMPKTIEQTTAASVGTIRSRFPALPRTHDGHPVAYFDGPGGTQVPQVVVDAMADYLLHHNANTHWAYPTSQETDALLASARQTLAEFLKGNADEIAFGAEHDLAHLPPGAGTRTRVGAGDEIVVTELDHHANVATLAGARRGPRGHACARRGMRSEDGTLDWRRASSAGEPERRSSLAIGGRVEPPRHDAGRAAPPRVPAHGALVFRRRRALRTPRARRRAGHRLRLPRLLRVQVLRAAHRHSVGRAALIESLDVPKVRPAHDNAPDRIETGTQNHEGIAGAGATVNFLASFGAGASRREQLRRAYSSMHERSTTQFAHLWSGLGAIRGVTCYGPPPGRPRSPTVSFRLDGVAPVVVARSLAGRGVFVSHGDFYASTVAERLGHPDGFVRVGLSGYSTVEEVDRLLEGVSRLASRS